MRAIAGIALLLLIPVGSAVAQEKEAVKAAYYVTDMLDGKNSRLEAWKIKFAPKVDRYTEPYTVRKDIFGKKDGQQVKSDGAWRDETRVDKQPTYLVERYEAHPSQLEAGERSFGHFEIRNVSDDSVVLNWPVFFEVHELGGIHRLILRGFLPEGKRLLVVRDYLRGEYSVPLRESQEMFEGNTVVSHFIFARVND